MYFLGIDVSTTATKALMIDSMGIVVAVSATEYPFETPRPLWSEQHPDLWWDGAQRSIRAVVEKSGVDPAQIGGVGLTGQMHGLVLLDESGNVLRPSILWKENNYRYLTWKRRCQLASDCGPNIGLLMMR